MSMLEESGIVGDNQTIFPIEGRAKERNESKRYSQSKEKERSNT